VKGALRKRKNSCSAFNAPIPQNTIKTNANDKLHDTQKRLPGKA